MLSITASCMAGDVVDPPRPHHGHVRPDDGGSLGAEAAMTTPPV